MTTLATDKRRDASVEQLKAAYVAGALPLEEMHRRVGLALTTPTQAGLDRLVADVQADTQPIDISPDSVPVGGLEFRARRPRRRLWLSALALGVTVGASTTSLVVHHENKVPSQCLVMNSHGVFHRLC